VIEYPKIQTLFDRDPKTFRVIEGGFRLPEFGIIAPSAWIYTEKIDGTNIRIGWNGTEVAIGGRTATAQIPADLVAYLVRTFTPDGFRAAFPDSSDVTLFGEGYGPGIQKGGGNYRDTKGLILFDVKAGDWWLNYDDVCDVAGKLGVPAVPALPLGTIQCAVGSVRNGLPSSSSSRPRLAEGIVARTNPIVLRRDGSLLIWKLKTFDFGAKKFHVLQKILAQKLRKEGKR
jgi:hypothetical protein